VIRAVATVAIYDPATGTGDQGVITYSGGMCNGASFEDKGATPTGTNFAHFAISNDGRRIDLVLTSNAPVSQTPPAIRSVPSLCPLYN
jgi:hypothetical protein